MKEFTRWGGDADIVSKLHVNPESVSRVEETKRRHAYGGWQDISILTFLDGGKATVVGHVAKELFHNAR